MWELFFILATANGTITIQAGEYDTVALCAEAVGKARITITEKYKPKRVKIFCLPKTIYD